MKNRKRLVSILAGIMAAVMILSLLFSILPSRVWAASSSEIRKQINALQDNRKDIKIGEQDRIRAELKMLRLDKLRSALP